jgi:hypothetical protein
MQVSLTVSVKSRGWRFQVRLRPADLLQDIKDAVVQNAAAVGETVVGFHSDCRWLMFETTAGAGAAAASGDGAGAGTGAAGGGGRCRSPWHVDMHTLTLLDDGVTRLL